MYLQFIATRKKSFFQAIGVTLVIAMLKKNMDIRKTMFTFFVVFNTFWVLRNYAPRVFQSMNQGAGFGTGYMLVGGGGTRDECRCVNQYNTRNLIQKIGMPVQLIPRSVNMTETRDEVKARIEREKNMDIIGARTKIIAEPKMVEQSDNADVVRVEDLCKALEESGFNPNWTMNKVMNMARNEIERKKLEQINLKALEKTGLNRITHEQIAKCYPSYIQSYECIRNKTKTRRTENNQILLADHCNWPSIKRDLDRSISRHYAEPTKQPNSEKTLLLKNYVLQRSELEFRNMVNMFQNKTKKDWSDHLANLKTKSAVGYQILGTDYYIPWDIFKKYKVCFGYL